MKIEQDDATLMEIYKIKNIEEISYTDLAMTNKSNRIVILPCIFLRYDGGKILNLCVDDEYFDIYIKQIIKVYNEEKDKEIIDNEFSPFRKQKIEIDEKTLKLLENSNLLNINDVYSFYENKQYYSDSLIFQKDEVNLYIPILLYHIKNLYDKTNTKINYNNYKLRGYKNKYSIDILVDGINETLYIDYKRIDENEINFNIKCSSNIINNMNIKIRFNKNNIKVDIVIDKNNILCCDSYEIINDKIIHENNIYKDNKLVKYKSEELDGYDNDNRLSYLDEDVNYKWFRLPWNSIYGISNNKTILSPLESIEDNHNKYISFSKSGFIIYENAFKTFKRDKTFEVEEYSITLDKVCKVIKGIKLYDEDTLYLIETYFNNEIKGNGYYNTYLENKYFYHIIDSKVIFDKSNMINIGKEDNIIFNSDIYDKDNVLKIVRRK